MAGAVLVEASAGTGKTYQIASLFVRLLLERRLEVDQLLVVTFTEAAASELRERIRKRLRQALDAHVKWLAADPIDDLDLAALVEERGASPDATDDRARLEAAIRGFDEAAIGTIHGFCRRVLQQNAFESGVDFEVELAGDVTPILWDLTRDFWTRYLHGADATLARALLDRGMGPTALLDLARRVASGGDLRVLPDASPPSSSDLAWQLWEAARAELRAAWEAEPGPPALRSVYFDIRPPFASLSQWEQAVGDLLVGPPRRGQGLPDELGPSAVAWLERHGSGRRGAEFVAAVAALHAAEAAIGPDLDGRILRMQLAFVDTVRAELPRRKAGLEVQSFDDLLHQLDRALADAARGPALRRAIRARLDLALIDEFQDTDPVQYAIFRRLFLEGEGGEAPRLYLIGDPKQAIYAFRGADIFAYIAARRDASEIRPLDRNWRTDRPLVQACNELFRRPRRPFVFDEIAYQPVAAQHEDRVRGWPCALTIRMLSREDRPAARLLDASQHATDPGWSAPGRVAGLRPDGRLGSGHLLRMVPRWVADDIAAVLAEGIELARAAEPGEVATWSPVGPGDIAVLTRSNAQAWEVQAALRARGIPSVLHSAASVFATREADDVSRVLHALVEPGREGLLRAALCTELVGLDAVAIEALDRDGALLDAWVARLRGWASLWRESGVLRALRAVIDDTGAAPRCLRLEDGERRLTNLLHLGELLHNAAVERDLGPARLLRWFDQERRQPTTDADARQLRLETDALAVQLVTVHSSKGLEYPLVWCPYMWEGKDLSREDKRFLEFHDRREGAGRTVDLGSPEHAAHAELLREERLAEDMRLAYVALTRARHRCVVYWGNAYRSERAALSTLMHQPGLAARAREIGDAPPPADADLAQATAARISGLEDADMIRDLEALTAAAGGTIGLVVGPPPPGPRWRSAEPVTSQLSVPPPRRADLDGGWRRASFTWLARGAREFVERDVDAGTGPGPGHAALETADPVPLAAFPAGAAAGIFFHEVLERLPPRASEEEARALVLGELARHRLPQTWAGVVADSLRAVGQAHLPMGGGFCLDDVPEEARFHELDFAFPVGGAGAPVSVAELADALSQLPVNGLPPGYAEHLRGLAVDTFRGLLVGSIDLVFVHEERWYLVDWKSNLLGQDPASYARAQMDRSMVEHHYPLQALLYAVALHRFLRWRLGAAYDPDRHLGGCAYVFLRGVEAGGARGIWTAQPSGALVAAWSSLLHRWSA